MQAALQQALLAGLLDSQPSTAAAGAEAAGACAVPALAGAHAGSFTDSDTSVNTPFGASQAGVQQVSSSGHAQAAWQHSSSGNLAQSVAHSLPATAKTIASRATPAAAAAGAAALATQATAATGVIHQLGEGYSKLSACTHGLTSLLLLGTLQHQQQHQQACQAQELAPAPGAAVAGNNDSQALTASTAGMQGLLDLSQPASSVKVEPCLPLATGHLQPQQQIGPQQQQQQAASVMRPQHTGRLTNVAQKVLRVAEGAAGLSQDDRLQLLAAVAELLVVLQDNQPGQD